MPKGPDAQYELNPYYWTMIRTAAFAWLKLEKAYMVIQYNIRHCTEIRADSRLLQSGAAQP